jgi:electron transport complex protein RnfC
VQYYRASKAELVQMRKDLAKSDHSRTRFEARQERLERETAEKDAQRKARKLAAEERAKQAVAAGDEGEADPIQAAINRAKAKKAAAAAPDDKPDVAQMAIEKALAARAASADLSPLAKAEANLQRLRERLAKSEAKLQQSRQSGSEETIIQALETGLEKLRPKISDAEQALAQLQGGEQQ